ncbi:MULTISPECIES: hypothetical protein [Streptomyces]|uniref:DUF4261 domain-containing protein n=1 Tax=Streptomyces griseiscabiei TaxID=2993540 RepID=A0ABU4LD00_9ACTN|nr:MULTISPECIES: hypothetical protein [Streptomyces]MBZ3907425.1 hypothetical protein [Streptomyces griseiscabiei]MDX2913518.1 hypothetical protein [Streptomyces griseiscabiei]
MSRSWQGTVVDGSDLLVPASGVTPRHVLCVVGVGLDPEILIRVVEEAGAGEFTVEEWEQEPDPRMREAFEAALAARSAIRDDEFGDEDWAAVDAHDSVAYVLSPPISQFNALDVSRQALAVTAALLANGATAVKNDSSGVACGRERWLTLADRAAAADNVDDLAIALCDAWVVPAIFDEGAFYSGGMHLLGQADVELAPGRDPEPEQLSEWLTTMDVARYYLLTEQPEGGIEDGEGFRITPDATRWIMHRVACELDEDDFSHNPFGFWRLTPA